MPTLFVSHSSKDDRQAEALRAWLVANGFDDLFIDHEDIVGGARWREALRASVGTCRVIVCLATDEWLASDECFNEFRAAWYMGKRVIPLLLVRAAQEVAGRRLAELRAEDQGVDLIPCLRADGTLDLAAAPEVEERLRRALRAAGALARVGLDPEAFEIDTHLRPDPFPGLASFGDEDADAALLYGRSQEIAEILEELRKMRAEADHRPLVIFGASGAGKSSLLKAGIIPRLRREAPAWLPLRAFRPGADPLLSFAAAFARTLGDCGQSEAPGVLRDRFGAAWRGAERDGAGTLTEKGVAALIDLLEAAGRQLRAASGHSSASILIAVDQAEELSRAEGESSDALADYLRAALAAPSRWQLAFTTRTDSFPELQRHRRFQNLNARGYDLRALPVFRFEAVVEAPARRYGVGVDPDAVTEMMRDAPHDDALPLLAFALQRLWRQYSASGRLTRENYENVGRLGGLIEDAAERALRGIEPTDDAILPSSEPPAHQVRLCADTFLPALARVNEQGLVTRRISDWANFSEEARALLMKFDRWRLVIRRGAEVAGGTVEVAHEALFREWKRFQTWLAPERERLEALRAIETAASVWLRHERRPHWLDHRGRRLKLARTLTHTARYGDRVGPREREYLDACRKAQYRRRSIAVSSVAAALVLAVVAAGVIEAREANFSYLHDAQQRNAALRDSDAPVAADAATRNALAALPAPASLALNFSSVPGGPDCNAVGADSDGECQLRLAGRVEPLVDTVGPKEEDHRKIVSANKQYDSNVVFYEDGSIEIRKGSLRRDVTALKNLLSENHMRITGSPDLRRLFVIYESGEGKLIDVDRGVVLRQLSYRGMPLQDIRATLTNDRLITRDERAWLGLWDSKDGARIAELVSANDATKFSSYRTLAGDRMILLQFAGLPARLIDCSDGHVYAEFAPSAAAVLFPSVDAIAALEGTRLELWQLKTVPIRQAVTIHDAGVRDIFFHPQGASALVLRDDGFLALWRFDSNELLTLEQKFSDETVDVQGGRTAAISLIIGDKSGIFLLDGTRLSKINVDPDLDVVGSQESSNEPSYVGAKYDISEDPRRLLIARGHFTAIVNVADGELETLISDYRKRIPIRFVDRDGTRVASVLRPWDLDNVDFNYSGGASLAISFTQIFVWKLTERKTLASAELRAWMCSHERRQYSPDLFVFTEQERNANSYLKGRPADVCQWQGLKSRAGWRQLLDRWVYLLTGHDAYATAVAS